VAGDRVVVAWGEESAAGDDRRVINGMLFKAKTGVAWRDVPERYGPWKTVYNRF